MLLVVVGTGLMGGSFALAARRRRVFDRVVGVEPDADRGRQALALGVVDEVLEAVPEEADAVLLAGPSHTIAPWVVRLAAHRGIVFDTGSVKAAVLADIRAEAGAVPGRFVPCHPLTGSEQSGPGAADGDLYQDAPVIITPHAQTEPDALEQVEGWWHQVGARVTTMDAAEHDRILARTSHLPHLLAFAYLRLVADGDLAHAAGGFRDFTRIGAGDPRVWAPIFRLNRTAVTAALNDFEAELARARQLLESGDEAGLADFIQTAADRRRRLGDGI